MGHIKSLGQNSISSICAKVICQIYVKVIYCILLLLLLLMSYINLALDELAHKFNVEGVLS